MTKKLKNGRLTKQNCYKTAASRPLFEFEIANGDQNKKTCIMRFVTLHIHCVYLPFTYEAKLTVIKETENCTCKYIATKSKSGILYVWNNARCPCRSRLKLGQRLISFVHAAWIQSVKTTYPVALTTFSGIVFPL